MTPRPHRIRRTGHGNSARSRIRPVVPRCARAPADGRRLRVGSICAVRGDRNRWRRCAQAGIARRRPAQRWIAQRWMDQGWTAQRWTAQRWTAPPADGRRWPAVPPHATRRTRPGAIHRSPAHPSAARACDPVERSRVPIRHRGAPLTCPGIPATGWLAGGWRRCAGYRRRAVLLLSPPYSHSFTFTGAGTSPPASRSGSAIASNKGRQRWM